MVKTHLLIGRNLSRALFSLLVLLTMLLTACGAGTSKQSTQSAEKSLQTPVSTPTPLIDDIKQTPDTYGVKQGPQPCPEEVKKAAYWDSIVGTVNTVNRVEQVSCANLMETPSLQALVTIRYIDTDARLDLYVYDAITQQQPEQIFTLKNLAKGDARISAYDTILTAEANPDSVLNTKHSVADMTQDLFREFDWSATSKKLEQTAFPGIFPDLTRYQAELDQMKVRKGVDIWKNDASQTAKALVTRFFGWKQQISTKLLLGGGNKDTDARVQVTETTPQKQSGPGILIMLSRLEGDIQNIWIVMSVQNLSSLQLTSPTPRSLQNNPLTLEGEGKAQKGVIGQAVIYDHLYNDIGHTLLQGKSSNGPTSYSTRLLYKSSFQTGNQEAILATYNRTESSNEIEAAVMEKVLLSPKATVVKGPIPCPDALAQPDYWTPFLPLTSKTATAQSVACGNLFGDPSLQALVIAQEKSNPELRSIFIFDGINNPRPQVAFKREGLLHGWAEISSYSTMLTSEVDANSRSNKGKSNDKLTNDLFREFTRNINSGSFEQAVFSGLYPDLTRYQAEHDQQQVENGRDTWKNDALATVQHMTKDLLGWNTSAPAQIIKGGGSNDLDATVQVSAQETFQVLLSRLEGKAHNIWIVTGIAIHPSFDITAPATGEEIKSPVTVQSRGKTIRKAATREVIILDHLYTTIGRQMLLEKDITTGENFSLQIPYQSTFSHGLQEGILLIGSKNETNQPLIPLAMQKVLLSA